MTAGGRCRRFLVSGRVQGVGFRYFVQREAEALGLSGWVRNLPDGRVEVLASGEGAQTEALLGRLWQGPGHALVTHVDESGCDEAPGAGFRVLPTPWG